MTQSAFFPFIVSTKNVIHVRKRIYASISRRQSNLDGGRDIIVVCGLGIGTIDITICFISTQVFMILFLQIHHGTVRDGPR